MTGDLVVLMDAVEIGRMIRDARGRVRFAYDPRYPAAATPLSLSMPAETYTLHDAGAWLEGLVPDNDQVLAGWAERMRARSSQAFDLLSTGIGWDCAGAVRFCRPDELESLRRRGGGLEPLSETDVARRLLELEEDGTRWHTERAGMFSISGAQPKMALRLEGGEWTQPWGDLPTTHLLKPPRSHLDRRVTRSIHVNEHLCQTAAAIVGIRAARTRLQSFEGQEALVVERFDRLGTQRIHAEDLCQAFGVRPRHKYQYDGGPGPSDIARLLRDAGRPGDDLRFLDALAYNWLIGATDSHAKNFGLILTGQEVTFAPIYDTASWVPYTIDPERARFAMKIGDGYRILKDSPAREWTVAARSMGFDSASTVDRVARLAARLPDAFATTVSRIADERWTRIANDLTGPILAHVGRQRRALESGPG